MKTTPLLPALLATTLCASLAAADTFHVEKTGFEINGTAYESAVVTPAEAGCLPGIFMVPNWMGVTGHAIEKAKLVAAMGYVVYVADVYSVGVRPTDAAEAGEAAGALRNDRSEMRKRAAAALSHFRGIAGSHGADASRLAAIGFCFGGGTVLELARSGADLKAFVSFHGDLLSPTLETHSGSIRGSVLVLHGMADPLVPLEDVEAFSRAMGATGVDWSIVGYGGAVHSFTDPTANAPGMALYDEMTARRAFAQMKTFLDEAL